jgi:hypothetical protein
MRKQATFRQSIPTHGFRPCALDALAFSGRIVAA